MQPPKSSVIILFYILIFYINFIYPISGLLNNIIMLSTSSSNYNLNLQNTQNSLQLVQFAVSIHLNVGSESFGVAEGRFLSIHFYLNWLWVIIWINLVCKLIEFFEQVVEYSLHLPEIVVPISYLQLILQMILDFTQCLLFAFGASLDVIFGHEVLAVEDGAGAGGETVIMAFVLFTLRDSWFYSTLKFIFHYLEAWIGHVWEYFSILIFLKSQYVHQR